VTAGQLGGSGGGMPLEAGAALPRRGGVGRGRQVGAGDGDPRQAAAAAPDRPQAVVVLRDADTARAGPLLAEGAVAASPAAAQATVATGRPREPEARRWRPPTQRRASGAAMGTMTPPWVARGLVAGLLAALTFRPAALLLLSLADLAPPPSLGLKPVPPLTVPPVAFVALWGALWGCVLALLLPRRDRGRRYWLAGPLLGAALPTGAALAIVLASGGPGALAGAAAWVDVAVGLAVNAAWGLGLALFLAAL
jgi:hypothetical protein